MHVKMRHFLMAVRADVGNHPVSAFGDAGDLCNMCDHAGEGGLFFGTGPCGKILPVDISALRDHQNVNRAGRRDILEGQRMIVLGDLGTGNFAAQDFRENIAVVIGHHFSSFW